MTTMNLWAEDLSAATRRYIELLGAGPKFTSEAAWRGPRYVEFRIGDYQHELGIIDRRFAPRPDTATRFPRHIVDERGDAPARAGETWIRAFAHSRPIPTRIGKNPACNFC
jgi:hypothetical protein